MANRFSVADWQKIEKLLYEKPLKYGMPEGVA